jgi:polysaccharide deacetylase family protein (PEP-CTERM system associated)
MQNLLTFDIEGFYENSDKLLSISSQEERYGIEVNTARIVEILDEFQVKGTFFILGHIARDMPHLVKSIALQGHEIACHSMEHKRLYDFDRKQVTNFLKDAKRYLEDAGGTDVVGFRPPEFSITAENLWVHDTLVELGFTYDSGVFPINFHNVYGIGNFKVSPFKLSCGLIELPMSTIRFGTNIPFGGGAYFRLYPYFITKCLGRIINRRGRPLVHYSHPYEMGRVVPFVKGLPALRRFRIYYGIKHFESKFRKMLRDFPFMRCRDFVEAEFTA